MPYSEHACRLRDPGLFQDGSFRRTTRKHKGKEYGVVLGRLKGESTMTEQSFRYPKPVWTAATARSHCRSHSGTFEAAANREETADADGISELDENTDCGCAERGTMANALNRGSERYAAALISQGKVSKDAAWSISAAEENSILGTPQNWARYSKWHLGVDASATDKTKERYKYPIGKGGTVYRGALVAIRQRAAQRGDTSIFQSAGRLMQKIDKRDERLQRMERSERIRSEVFERTVELERAGIDVENRTVPASLSSEQPVQRWFGKEILVHAAEAVDLSRAIGGLPMGINHGTRIGKVRDIALKDGKLRGVLHFSPNGPDAQLAWADVRDGFLDSTSIRYRVNKWEEQADSDEVHITSWTPLEAGPVDVPADHTVGIGRGENIMTDHIDDTDLGGNESDGQQPNVTQFRRDFEQARKQGVAEGIRKAKQRVAEIDALFDNPIIPRSTMARELRNQAVDADWTVDKTREAIMEFLRQLSEGVVDLGQVDDVRLGVSGAKDAIAIAKELAERHRAGAQQSVSDGSNAAQGAGNRRELGRIEAGTDSIEKFRDGASQALMLRAGMLTEKEEIAAARGGGLASFTLSELVREWCAMRGISTRGLDRMGLAGMAFKRVGPATESDFPGILANVATKSALMGWTQAPVTWDQWCNRGSLPDFKAATIAGLSGFSDLDQIPHAGGPYQYGNMAEQSETASLETFGKLFGVSRRSIINDDLNEFTRTPMKMGAAAARKVNALAYYPLIGAANPPVGQVMAYDSTPLFDASGHGSNYVAGGGAAPTATTLDTAFNAMAKQTAPVRAGDSSLIYLNLIPQYLIVPAALRATANALVENLYDPAATAGTLKKNPYYQQLTVVSDAILDGKIANGTTGWYLACAKGSAVIDTVTVYFLDGNDQPYLEEQDQFTDDGMTWKVRIDAIARALDHRGLYYNDGA